MTERLLKLVGPVHIVGGLVLFATGFIPAAQELLQSAIVVTDDFVWSPFFTAILGPTIASWGVLFGALVNQFYSQPAITFVARDGSVGRDLGATRYDFMPRIWSLRRRNRECGRVRRTRIWVVLIAIVAGVTNATIIATSRKS